ncbi:uncharacterized protein LOC108741971 [Agrilus planipennis]|uniref:Uncharacterized protein LOC108741971 n=1 Tax=Agrilus planipennis TaxID=224129 RepID=A0A1W4X8N4_AGRPL|nr:uncharacterized protein LOC108741971 [Agrilus planipennis]
MGKKGKRTRWRTLTLNGHESDSESSGTAPSFKFSKSYQPRYSKYPYSSQSTPTRKFQYEGKSTRSSSTTSEQKITFNEDEYTRITTPRQDVLFKKGYLSKPKNYHTQTSTGTTCSTANSTSTCTPDHHSADGAEGTDLEYESQFVFPNVFVDQNGIYYLNSLEPFPFVVYNAAPAYYPPECPSSKTKRYSTDSAVESASPNNEEVLTNGGGLDSTTLSGVPVFQQEFLQSSTSINYYSNGASQNDAHTDPRSSSNDVRRLKKKRRKRLSTLQQQSQEGPASSEHTDNGESDEVLSQSETGSNVGETSYVSSLQINTPEKQSESITQDRSVPKTDSTNASLSTHGSESENERDVESSGHVKQIDSCDIKDDKEDAEESISEEELSNNECKAKEDESHIENHSLAHHSDVVVAHKEGEDVIVEVESKTDNVNINASTESSVEETQKNSYQLKPDAEEFVPRALRHPQHLPLNPALQFVNLPPTYMPIPIINPIGSLPPTTQQSFSPVFLPPPGIPPPLNIVSQPQPPPPPPQPSSSSLDTKAICTYQPSIQNVTTEPTSKQETSTKEVESSITNIKSESLVNDVTENVNDKVKESQIPNGSENQQTNKVPHQGNRIDIAQIVFKLEEAAKEQNQEKPQQNVQRRQNKFNNRSPQRTFYGDNRQKVFGNGPRRNNFYNRRNEQSHKIHENNMKQQKPAENQPAKKSEVKNQKLPTSENILRNDVNSIDNVSQVRLKSSPNRSFSTSSRSAPNPVSIVEKKIQNDQKVHQSPVNCSKMVQQQSAQSPARNGSKFDKQDRKSDKPQFVQRNHSSPRNSIQHKEIAVQNSPKKLSNSQNQWISVFNRKKRRNKNQEDSENETNQDLIEVESFESSFVAQVNDVKESPDNVLANEVEVINPSEKLENVQHSLENVSVAQGQPVSEAHPKEDTTIPENVNDKSEEAVLIVESQEVPATKIVSEEDNQKLEEKNINSEKKAGTNKFEKKIQNKSTKKSQKAQSRKIMITDPDTSFILHTNPTDVTEDNECKPLKIEAPEDVHLGEDDKVEEVIENSSKDDLPIAAVVTEEPVKDNIQENVEETVASHVEAVVTDEAAGTASDTSDKKSKRKKKRVTLKSNLNKNRSASSSSSVLNVDDPYNYLLEDIILKDSDNKTNEEISEELDRIIQKGMYTSLEEKLKTINVSDSTEDQFFKMLNCDSFVQKKPAQSNTTSIKITDFASILKNSIFGGKQAEQAQKVEASFPQITFSNVEDLPQPSTSRSGFFLENPETTELIKNITNNTVDVEPPLFQICMVEHHPNVKSKSDNKLKCKNKRSKRPSSPLQPNPKIIEITNDSKGTTTTNSKVSRKNGDFFRDSNESGNDTLIDEREDKVSPLENGKETLYPITQAVKEWMTKTRETTPDIEILKSPDVILKEFIESDSEIEETETGSARDIGAIAEKIPNGYSNHNGVGEVVKKMTPEEEVTLFTANDDWSLSPQTSIEEEDLLECWDNEIPKNPSEIDPVLNKKMNGKIENGFGEDDDDVIEEYESKYGKNEDYLKLKAEVEEQKKRMNFAKHGNLPYRAICCNIM